MFYNSTAASTFHGGTIAATGGGGLEVDGGTLTLSGSISYSGGTIVSGGELIVTTNNGLLGGSSLSVGNAQGFPATPVVLPGHPVPGRGIAPVPEPGTLVLLYSARCS